MQCPRVSLPPWMTSTLNTQSGTSECEPLLNIHHLPHPHLNLRFTLFRVGQVVSIKSKVNRAFNSSMEVRDTPVTLVFVHSRHSCQLSLRITDLSKHASTYFDSVFNFQRIYSGGHTS